MIAAPSIVEPEFRIDDDAQRDASAEVAARSTEARHMEIEERKVGLVLGHKLDGVDAIVRRTDHFQPRRGPW
jgi:hypothetical protein